MKKVKNILSTLFILCMGATAYAQDMDILANPDSLKAARIDSLVQVAADSYRSLVTAKNSGEAYGVIFPITYQCYLDNMAVLDELQPGSHAQNQVKGMLLDINQDLEAGAYFYSSNNDTQNLSKFAQAYLDTQLLDVFKGVNFKRDQAFPTFAYIAASKAYNERQFDRAIEYFKLYFAGGGDEAHRQQVYLFMTQACLNSQNYELAITTARQALKLYPNHEQLLMLAIQSCIDGGHGEALQEFLTPALTLRSDDEALLNLQGKLYEDDNQYSQALGIYNHIEAVAPQKLSTAKHIALCYYNMAVGYFNDAINEDDEKQSRKARRQSKDYFGAAAQKLEEVLASDPMAVKYLKSLGVSYLCLEEKEKFDNINRQLTALGEDALSDVFVPPMMTFNDNNKRNFDYMLGDSRASSIDAPLYSEYGRDYISRGLEKWTQKGEFEKMEDYTRRVNDVTIKAEYDRLNSEAKEKYLEKYARNLRLSDLQLMPYDSNNETFMINSSYGPFTLNVPIKDNEAERFKSNWEGMRFRNPKYYIDDDKVLIASITVQTPDGKSYSYDNSQGAAYAHQDIAIDFNAILGSNRPANGGNQVASTTATITRKSDVDENIPVTTKVAGKTFALVIANENYDNVTQVQSALHDGERFAEYCQRTLGIPASNVTLLKNATYGKMLGAVNQLKNTVNAFGGEAEVIVYYAGHGLPDEATKDAYLLPTDGVPTMLSTSYSLDKFYSDLGNMDANSVMVFLDACFSGAKRDGGMLYDARGVTISHKDAAPKGNMMVFSAASGQETALPYTDKNHGLFTYFLLKKLQETKGNVTLKELSDYVITNVKQQSNLINHKSQTPSVTTSGRMAQEWNRKKLAPQ